MAFTPANPVVVGGPTLKSDFDAGWDNTVIGRSTSTGLINTVGDATDGLIMLPAAWPSFSAYKSAQQNGITGLVKITWDSEEFDTNSNFDSTTNYRFQPTAAGKYLLTASIHWNNAGANDDIILHLYEDGASIKYVAELADDTTPTMQITAIVNANGSSNYYELFTENVTRNTANLTGTITESYFMGSRIG